MNTYLLPVSDGETAWIERVYAKSYGEAETKFVKLLADQYECVDLGGDIKDATAALSDEDVVIGDVYDVEEF